MSRINRMKLEDIFNQTDLILRENDIVYFCEDLQVIKEFIESCNGTQNRQEDVKKFLIDNEESINKEKLILLLVKNYRDNLETIKLRKKELNRAIKSGSKERESTIEEFSNMNMQEFIQKDNLEKALKLAKGIDTIIPMYYYNPAIQSYEVEVIDSREFIDGKTVNKSKNLRRFEEVDEYFKDKNSQENLGMEYVIQLLLLTDFYEIFSDSQLGDHIRTMILENAVIEEGIKTREELEDIKATNYSEYTRIIDETEFINLLPSVKKAIKQYVQYMDIDKMLLISAYRFNEGLESGIINGNNVLVTKQILQGILSNFKNENIKVLCSLQNKKNNSYNSQKLQYSVKDIRRCLDKIIDDQYLTVEQIQEYKEKIKNREINLSSIEQAYIDIIFSTQELEEIAVLSDENFVYVLSKLNWNKDEILQVIHNKELCSSELLEKLIMSQTIDSRDVLCLYLNGKIAIEQIKTIKEIINLPETINSYELIQYYKNSIEKDSNEEEKNKFDRYLELYKLVLIEDKTVEEQEKSSNELINALVDSYKGKEYIKICKDYYKKGLLTLDVLLDWNGEKFVIDLYNDGEISVNDVERLVKERKLPFEYISDVYFKLANDSNIDYEQRLGYIKSGYITEKDIFKIYEQNLIFEEDLKELEKLRIITQEKLEKAINKRTKEDLEKHSSIKLLGLDTLTKKKNDIYLDSKTKGYMVGGTKTKKMLIDPNERAEYINLFKAYRAETDLEEDSPFYNYEFYVIPDESGKIGLNSVVIAERYYEDKDTEEKFAVDNATYFFKYKDLMVLSNLKKSEMTKERKNIVFTANHTLATDEKGGRWGASVIYAIVKTMLSSDLKEYSKENQRRIIIEKLNHIYTEEEIREILKKCEEIDSGEYNYEIINPEGGLVRKKINKNNNKENIHNGDEGR